MTTETRIKSIKLADGKVEICGIDKFGEADEKEWTSRSFDNPHPDLVAALDKLVPEIRKLLGLHVKWADNALSVMKVSWSFSETTDVEGATMTCRADLECADSPLIFNTPHLPYDQYSQSGNSPTMPGDLQKLLDAVKKETDGYLNGKRAQADMFKEAAE
jgi:hypothetical protein